MYKRYPHDSRNKLSHKVTIYRYHKNVESDEKEPKRRERERERNEERQKELKKKMKEINKWIKNKQNKNEKQK